jgi:predicted flap endonuclease-1-like 5' DNA nuclease
MNQTDAISAAPTDSTAIITTAHLVVIVLLAVAAMLVIWWGGRRRARERAEREASHTETVVARDTVEPAPINLPVTPPPSPLVADPAPMPDVTAPIAEPSPAPAPTPVPAPSATPDAAPVTPAPAVTNADADQPVTVLKGLGPKVAARLAEQGITRVGQLAALTPNEAEALDAALGAFSGRMARDRWIEQAQLLAAGDRAGYEATFGKLG